ncbi:STAS domain-containing protein [Polyangium jinanense]|nr:STAS domain-containing protein [Polyangium jinanense]
MSQHDLEQECKALRARVAELEARLERAVPDEAPLSKGPIHKLEMAQVLRVLLDHLDLVVWAVDAKGTFTFHDGKAIDRVGHQRGQFLGQNVFAVLEDKGATGLRKALSGAPAHEITEAHGIVWENWHTPTYDGEGRVTGVVTLSLDVTESMRTKAELTAKLTLIERQQDVIRNLETPIIQVWDRVLTVPMVGVVDSRRAARVTEDLLAAVSHTQARFAILDLTGVDVVDTATAGHILKILGAVRLLGAEGIITGIRPVVAQTIISLGLDLSRVRTLATLRDALALAVRSLGEHDRFAFTRST